MPAYCTTQLYVHPIRCVSALDWAQVLVQQVNSPRVSRDVGEQCGFRLCNHHPTTLRGLHNSQCPYRIIMLLIQQRALNKCYFAAESSH
jgi:hypothetical protein